MNMCQNATIFPKRRLPARPSKSGWTCLSRAEHVCPWFIIGIECQLFVPRCFCCVKNIENPWCNSNWILCQVTVANTGHRCKCLIIKLFQSYTILNIKTKIVSLRVFTKTFRPFLHLRTAVQFKVRIPRSESTSMWCVTTKEISRQDKLCVPSWSIS